jgi:hypothetical protein
LTETLESGNYTAADIEEMVTNTNDLLDETVTVRIESSQLTNSTVQGLMMANLVDEILESYNAAYGIEEEHDEHDEGMSMTDEGMSMTDETHDEGTTMSNSTTPTEEELEELTTFELAELYPEYVNEESGEGTHSGNETHDTIVAVHAYDSAVALTERVQELYETKLKAMAAANTTQAVMDLEDGLDHLMQAIDDKVPPGEVETILHSEIHPNIQIAYNLQVIPEFPLPILLALTGIAGVIAYTRIKGIRNPF